MFASPALGQSRVGPNPLGNTKAPMPPAAAEFAENINDGGIEQKIGNLLPMDLPFIDENGKPVKLGDYFNDDKPVIIDFAYFECPLTCPMVISGIIDATQSVGDDWVPGENFEVLTISINPNDSPVAALGQQNAVVERFGGPESKLGAGAREGWHFLTGREIDIQRLTHEAGFNFVPVPETNDFAHAAVLIFVSPEGEVTRYLPNHVYAERDFRMALTEASQGKQGTFFDMVLQLCYNYDHTLGTYTADALALMKLAGGVTLITLASVIGGLFYFEHRRRDRLDDGPPDSTPTPA